MSLLSELKRRSVFKVAVAYGITAWVLIQIAAIIFPALQLPDWTLTFVTIVIIIGFPIALIIAWAFELTPEGVKADPQLSWFKAIAPMSGRKLDFVIIASLTAAVVFLIVDNYVGDTTIVPPEMAQDVGSTNDGVKVAMAVLPFANISGDPSQSALADGITEELMNLLAKIDGVRMTARTSSFAFKDQAVDIREIAKTLNVTTVLEGSVRKSGNRIRISAQLVNASDGYQIWSDSYDRELTDIFTIQDDIASAIVSQLEPHIGVVESPTRGKPTDNLTAYELFLDARSRGHLLTERSARQVIDLYRAAIVLDPNFAEAYEGIAFTAWVNTSLLDEEGPDYWWGIIEQMARKALALNPDLVVAELILGNVTDSNWTLEGWLETVERAVSREPNNLQVRGPYFVALHQRGYLAEALDQAKYIFDIDPLNNLAHYHLGNAYLANGLVSEGVAALKQASEQGVGPANAVLARHYFREEQDEQAIRYWKEALKLNGKDPTLAEKWIRLSRESIGNKEAVQELRDEYPFNPLFFFFATKTADLLFPEMKRAIEEESKDFYVFLVTFWTFADPTLMSDPRFMSVMKDYGAFKVWQKRGPPDRCKAVGESYLCE